MHTLDGVHHQSHAAAEVGLSMIVTLGIRLVAEVETQVLVEGDRELEIVWIGTQALKPSTHRVALVRRSLFDHAEESLLKQFLKPTVGELGLAPGYTLLFDFGCYHDLKATERSSYADGVTALAGSGATLLMMAFTRPVRPVTTGVTEPELRDRFGGGWDLLWSRPNEEPGTTAMTRASATWFCMARP